MKIQDVYDNIAPSFDKTRTRVWEPVQQFINNLPPNQYICDVGCGNGKNTIFKTHDFECCDISLEMVKITKNKGKSTLQTNMLELPYRDSTFDVSMSVAVIHHIEIPSLRLVAINELYRITQPGGKILLTFWAREDFNIKYSLVPNMSPGDTLVPWTYNNVIYQRYYYLYTKEELQHIFNKYQYSIECFKHNWIVIITVDDSKNIF